MNLNHLLALLVLALACSARTTTASELDYAEPPRPQAASLQPQSHGPVVLRDRAGVTIRGLKIDQDLSVSLENCEDVTIISCDLRSIQASGVRRLRIYNSYLHDSTRNAVSLDGCDDVIVQGNRMHNIATGVYAHDSTRVQVIGNLVVDVQGPFPRGQLAQFDKVTGPGNLILGNVGVNHHQRSNPEDMINLFQSYGTPESPIRVELNHLAGDPNLGSQDFSKSGSGIMLGDGGGQYQRATNNTLVSPGQVGIGVAGGGDILVDHNTIAGAFSNVANVGLYTWNQYPDAPAGKVSVRRNRVAWVNNQLASNPYWNGDGFEQVTQDDNTFGDADLGVEDLPLPVDGNIPPIPFGDAPAYPYQVR